VENLQTQPESPTPQNVTVRSSRPRDYLAERSRCPSDCRGRHPSASRPRYGHPAGLSARAASLERAIFDANAAVICRTRSPHSSSLLAIAHGPARTLYCGARLGHWIGTPLRFPNMELAWNSSGDPHCAVAGRQKRCRSALRKRRPSRTTPASYLRKNLAQAYGLTGLLSGPPFFADIRADPHRNGPG
jgi:hypothetical protein